MYIIVEIYEMDIIPINKTMAKESNQTKNRTFCGGSQKNRLEWLKKEPFSNFLKPFVGGGSNHFFYKFLIRSRP